MGITKFPTGVLVKNKFISGKIYEVKSQHGSKVMVIHNDLILTFDYKSLVRV